MHPAFVIGFALCAFMAGARAETGVPTVAAPCLSCHSADGRPVLPDVPIIAGQQSAYLVSALRSYRVGGSRSAGQALVMQQFVKDLSDSDILLLARWFGESK